MRGYSVTQRFLFPNSTVAAIPFVLTKYEEKNDFADYESRCLRKRS